MAISVLDQVFLSDYLLPPASPTACLSDDAPSLLDRTLASPIALLRVRLNNQVL